MASAAVADAASGRSTRRLAHQPTPAPASVVSSGGGQQRDAERLERLLELAERHDLEVGAVDRRRAGRRRRAGCRPSWSKRMRAGSPRRTVVAQHGGQHLLAELGGARANQRSPTTQHGVRAGRASGASSSSVGRVDRRAGSASAARAAAAPRSTRSGRCARSPTLALVEQVLAGERRRWRPPSTTARSSGADAEGERDAGPQPEAGQQAGERARHGASADAARPSRPGACSRGRAR